MNLVSSSNSFDPKILLHLSHLDLLIFLLIPRQMLQCYQGHSLSSSSKLSSMFTSFLKIPLTSPYRASHSLLGHHIALWTYLYYDTTFKILSPLSYHEFLQGREFLFISVS